MDKGKKQYFIFLLLALLFGSIGGASAYSLMANNIGFTPKDTSWNVKNVEAAVNDLYYKSPGVPTGTVLSLMGNNAPYGYLACDGSTYNINDYVKLSSYIKSQFGSYNYFGGDGETTFAVPDLRGEFLRGTGLAVGAHQDPTIHPWLSASTTYLDFYTNSGTSVINPDILNNNGEYNRYTGLSTNSKYTGSRSYTSRPTNTSVLYIIKY